jgi:glycosyltransferase involved in cell wall biosynthesis
MAASLARHGRALGLDPTMVAYLGDGPFRAAVERSGVRTELVPNAPSGFSPSLPLRLARWLRREKVDVLHTHHLGPFLYGAPAARLAGVAHVHTEHSHELYDAPRRRAIGRSMPRLARVVGVSPEIASFHRRELGSEIDVVPNGVEIPRAPGDAAARSAARARLAIPAEHAVLGCLARLSPEKRHEDLLRALGLAGGRSTLVLLGDGPERGRLEELARELGIASRVRFLGEVSSPEEILPAIDVMALASDREGLPMALLESMAFGIPVVATAVGGIPELLEEGGGVLVRPRDPLSLGIALRLLADDGAGRARLGAHARARVAARYSAERMAARYREIYAEELRRRGRPCV